MKIDPLMTKGGQVDWIRFLFDVIFYENIG